MKERNRVVFLCLEMNTYYAGPRLVFTQLMQFPEIIFLVSKLKPDVTFQKYLRFWKMDTLIISQIGS